MTTKLDASKQVEQAIDAALEAIRDYDDDIVPRLMWIQYFLQGAEMEFGKKITRQVRGMLNERFEFGQW